MIVQPLPWLPAAPPGAVADYLANVGDAWAAQWIEAPQTCAVEPDTSPFARAANWRGCAAAAVGAARDDFVALGHAAVAGQADAANGRDREILEAIGRKAVADLALSLCRFAETDAAAADLPVAPGEAPGEFHRLSGTGWSVAIFLDASAQIRLRRHMAGARRQPKLATLAEALAPEVVRLGCHLGRASLSAADVTALARGDLLVLDRRIADRLPLTVEGIVAAHGRACVKSAGGTLSIRITDPIDLTAGSD